MSTWRSFRRIAFLRSSASVRWGGLRPTTPGTIPSRVCTSTRCPTSTWGSQPPDWTTWRKPLSLTWLTRRAISSMWPTIAISGASPAPETRATVVPSLSVVTSSANASAASRHTRAGRPSCPGGPGAVSSLWSRSGTGTGERLAPLNGRLDGHRAVQRVGDEAVLVRGVHELAHALLARVAVHRDPRPQRDVGDPHRLLVLRHQRGRVVVVGHDVDARLCREVQEPQHLARGRGHQEQLLGVEDRGVALRLTGRHAQLLLGGRGRHRMRAVVALPAEAGRPRPVKPCLVAVPGDPWRIGACRTSSWC